MLFYGLLIAWVTGTLAQTACNGDASLCSKTFDQVAYATTHNSFAFQANAAANQDYSIATQLQNGIRGLMLEANTIANDTTTVELCHTSCSILDGGSAADTLTVIKSFLDSNPNEIVTILWRNAGSFAPSDFEAAANSAGITNYMYTQATGSAWPTLSSMISSGKRVVNFMDQGADSTVPWLMAEYDFVFETPWQVTNANNFSCVVDRPSNPPNPPSQMMYVMNHYLYGNLNLGGVTIQVPQKGLANSTNGQNLEDEANTCKSTFSRIPNYVAVDFYEMGDIFQTVDSLNGVQYVAKPLGSASSASSTSINTSSAVQDTVSMRHFTLMLMVALTMAWVL